MAAVPQRAESRHARGVARTMLGREREAIADFDRAASIRSEPVYVVEARLGARGRIGDSVGVRLDRDAAARLRAEHEGCAACLDPFRY